MLSTRTTFLPAMIVAHLSHDRQPMFGGVIDALEIVLASGVGDALDGLGIAGAQFGIAADAAAFFGGAQPVLGAFPNERALEFGDRAEHLQGETTLRSGRVDRIGERFEMRALGVEFGDDRQEMRQRPRQAVEPGDHQHIAALNLGQSLGELRPRRFGTRHMLAKNHRAAGGLQHVGLSVCNLVLGRNACVADQRHGLGDRLPEDQQGTFLTMKPNWAATRRHDQARDQEHDGGSPTGRSRLRFPRGA